VAVSSANIKEPLAVRYGFSNSDTVNFFDAEGNPARAFRTDTFKLPTQPAEAKGESK
jgi:sialate O-acetylesterase